MQIKAVLPTSLIEYPGHIATVLYVGACNFRCPYCYNVDLVLRPAQLPDIEVAEVLQGLEMRRGFVDGVVITGGEPTIQADLAAFLSQIRRLGLAVKLDTNGYRPDVLRTCLQQGLVDYVAMDIKSSLPKYGQAAGATVDKELLLQSIQLLLHADIEYEFRTTVVPGLVDVEDVQAIVALIRGAKRYYLQYFLPAATVGWGEQVPVGSPSFDVMQQMAEIASRVVEEVGIRGQPYPREMLRSTVAQNRER
ncbi:MAG: anaerobic ribonucleoside-triphosphate reductase activating protein [Candidatus Hadarchaeum sp.]